MSANNSVDQRKTVRQLWRAAAQGDGALEAPPHPQP